MGNQSQINGVSLQMIAGCIICLRVMDHIKVGTHEMGRNHLCAICPDKKRMQNSYTRWSPAYMKNKC